jgi:hypothetical protein
MKRIIKFIFIVLLTLIALPIAFLVCTQVWFYASCPIYEFQEPQCFSGDSIYNPYRNTVFDEWKKCIFHVHTKDWKGITNGENQSSDIFAVYKSLKYDVVAISNYMKVDTSGLHNSDYIPCYEHGYGYGKTHQLVMGNHSPILWRDYIFIQNLSQKQYTIDLLKARCELLAINHPDLRYGYNPEDFKYLSNYDVMEVLNGARYSFAHWDSALSHGHTAWLTANDDAHNVNDLSIVQRVAVFIHSPDATRRDILDNLACGAAFGVHFPKIAPQWDEKYEAANRVSFPETITVSHDTLQVVWQKNMSEIVFTGDNGKTLATAINTNHAHYVIQPENTYVRITLKADNGLVYYLNPVVRSSDGTMPPKQTIAYVHSGKTLLKRALIVALLFLSCSLWIIIKYKKRKK